MRKILLVIVLFTCLFSAIAQPVSMEEATSAAQCFLHTQSKTLIRCAKVVKSAAHDNLLYIFDAENSFVVISGDKRVPPVLAFTDHQLYNDADIAAPAQMWLDHYARQIEAMTSLPATTPIHPEWRSVLAKQPAFRQQGEVSPLMKSHWGQEEFYNYYCPQDFDGFNGRVVTGCVATAMAQLIYYFRFPETGVGSYSYTDENYGVQSADYGATTYDYAAMCDEPTAINTAISTLMHHCGVGVDMVYGPDGSGMNNHSAARVLRTFFKFSPETEYLFRDSTNLDWDSVIVAHLSHNIPMYYAGWSNPNINGHGFICDGYRLVDDNYYYHFNFGWDGSSDGYFYTNALNLSGTHFNLSQELIVNAYPDTVNYTYPAIAPVVGSTTLTTAQGSFTDGTLAAANYRTNMNYRWHIQPEVENLQRIFLDVDFDIAAGDTLYILPDGAANTAVALSDTTGTLVINWQTDSVCVRLITDGTPDPDHFGFRANFTTERTEYCAGRQNLTAATGTITDGSEESPYNSLMYCSWRVVLNSYSAITLHIREFDLEEGHDFFYVFDNTISNERLLDVFTGTMPDTTIVYDKKRLSFVFESDEQQQGNGFLMDYYGGYVGVEEHSNTAVQVYPNPADHLATVLSDVAIRQVVLRDLTGRVVRNITPNDTQCSISLQGLSKGIYTLQIFSENRCSTIKLIKK